MVELDWIAIGVATVSAFLLGGLWYSPLLFANPWMAAAKVTKEETAQNLGAVFGQAILSAFVTAIAYGFFASGMPLTQNIIAGAVTGFGLVAASLSLNYAFERRPLALLLINGGYYLVQFTLYGVIFGLL